MHACWQRCCTSAGSGGAVTRSAASFPATMLCGCSLSQPLVDAGQVVGLADLGHVVHLQRETAGPAVLQLAHMLQPHLRSRALVCNPQPHN